MQDGQSEANTTVTRFGTFEAALRSATDLDAFAGSPEAAALLDDILSQAEDARAVSFAVLDGILQFDHTSELGRIAEAAAHFAADTGIASEAALVVGRLQSAAIAEEFSRGSGAASLSTIARNMIQGLRIQGRDTDELAALWCTAELDVIATHIRPSPLVTKLLPRLVEGGKKIALISSRIYEADRIKPILRDRAIGLPEGASILSHADFDEAPSTLRAAEDALGIAPQDILHLGPDLERDMVLAGAAGWKVRYLPVPDAVRAARRADHAATATRLFGSADYSLPQVLSDE